MSQTSEAYGEHNWRRGPTFDFSGINTSYICIDCWTTIGGPYDGGVAEFDGDREGWFPEDQLVHVPASHNGMYEKTECKGKSDA